MTKKGRWWWVKRVCTMMNSTVYVYRFKKNAHSNEHPEYSFCDKNFRLITGLKLKEGEVRKVRLEWEK